MLAPSHGLLPPSMAALAPLLNAAAADPMVSLAPVIEHASSKFSDSPDPSLFLRDLVSAVTQVSAGRR